MTVPHLHRAPMLGARQHEQSWEPAYTCGPSRSCPPPPASFITAVLSCDFGVTLLYHMLAYEFFAEQNIC